MKSVKHVKSVHHSQSGEIGHVPRFIQNPNHNEWEKRGYIGCEKSLHHDPWRPLAYFVVRKMERPEEEPLEKSVAFHAGEEERLGRSIGSWVIQHRQFSLYVFHLPCCHVPPHTLFLFSLNLFVYFLNFEDSVCDFTPQIKGLKNKQVLNHVL